MEKQRLPTKQRILDEALTLFSIKGFDSVTVAEIADAVGIKAPSLYKHYKSKQEIFEAIIIEMDARYERQWASMRLNGKESGKGKDVYMNISGEQLIEMAKGLFLYFLHDEYMCKFRKFLTVSQYSSKELSTLNIKRNIDEPLSYQAMLFGMLAGPGLLSPENSRIMALQFYSPIFLLLALCDCHPEREEEAIHMLEQHIKQFNRLYRVAE